jgi:glucosamine kinase
MSKRYFIGVDGGGTSSRLCIEDEQGNFLAKVKNGPASIRWSVEITWQSINHAFKEACDIANIDIKDANNEFYAGMGLAGCEVEQAKHDFLSHPANPFKQIILESDGYTACLGAHEDQDGAIITVGTGVVAFIIQNHKAKQISGWGFPHDDRGGGAWLGLEAAHLALQMLDKRIDSSPLLLAILNKFNDNAHQFNEWCIAANANQYATLAPLVIEYVEHHDPNALYLIKAAAAEIDSLYNGILRCQNNTEQSLPCCLFGGIAPFIKPWINKQLHNSLVERKHGATKGAVFMIRKAILGHI